MGLVELLDLDGYAEEDKPLVAYTGIAAVFLGSFGPWLVWAARSGRLPRRPALRDVVVLGVATHKLARLIARDTVTSPLRAPFVRYEGPGTANELDESPRGAGARRAVGELVFCPPCVGTWVAAGLLVGYVHAPRPTRLVASGLAAMTISDFLHRGFVAAGRD